MALRNVAITPGSGDQVRFDSGMQLIKPAYGAEGVENLMDEKFSTESKQIDANTKLDTIVTALANLLTELQQKTEPTNTQAISADALPLPTGAATQATLASLLTNTPAPGAAAPSASTPITLPLDVAVNGGAALSAINTDLLTGNASGWYDARNFHSASFQIIGSAGIAAGAVIFEQTNDTTAASAGNVWAVEEDTGLTPTPQIAAITIAASTTRMFRAPVTAGWVRVRISTGFTGGTVQCAAMFSQLPYQRMVQTVAQATAANLNATVSGTITASGTVGPAAHDAVISGNPLRTAGRALTANYTPVASGDVADEVATLTGSKIVKQFSIPEAEFVGIDDITNSTTAKQIKNATASNQNYVTGISLGSDTLGAAGDIQLRSTPVASTTATIASNTLVMAATYNWKVGDLVYVTASTVTGLSAGSYYYILTVSGANLTFSATRGGSTLVISGTTVSATLAKILFRHRLQTTSLPLTSVRFDDPIGGGTNLPIEVCTPTALTSGRVDFNVHGYVAP